jgi:hypothetical protein
MPHQGNEVPLMQTSTSKESQTWNHRRHRKPGHSQELGPAFLPAFPLSHLAPGGCPPASGNTPKHSSCSDKQGHCGLIHSVTGAG